MDKPSALAIWGHDNKLSAEQLDRFKAIKTDIEKRAAPAVLGLAVTAKNIYANMFADKEDQKLRKKLEARLHRYGRELINLKGESFREMLAVLTPAQRQLVRSEVEKAQGPADLGELIEQIFGLKEK